MIWVGRSSVPSSGIVVATSRSANDPVSIGANGVAGDTRVNTPVSTAELSCTTDAGAVTVAGTFRPTFTGWISVGIPASGRRRSTVKMTKIAIVVSANKAPFANQAIAGSPPLPIAANAEVIYDTGMRESKNRLIRDGHSVNHTKPDTDA